MTKPTTVPVPSRPPLTVPPEVVPDLEQFVIEDGKPVDGILTEKQMRLLTEPLKNNWSAPDGQPFVVLADVGVFSAIREPPIVPDVLLAVGVRQGTDLTERENLSYFVWTRGKVPDVAIEIVSNREGGEDSDKLRTYARIGVPYYVIFDPDDVLRAGVLRVFSLQVRRYRAQAKPYFLEEVGLGIRLWDGAFEGINLSWLRWCDSKGNVIPTGRKTRGEAEKKRADLEKKRTHIQKKRVQIERARADEEQKRANRAEKELARLRQKLREQGIEPPE